MKRPWQQLIQQIAVSDFGVTQHTLPMVRYRDGSPARVNQPPAGVTPRRAAVLVIVAQHHQDVQIVLTQRKHHLREHAGEISFPGGRIEANEDAFQAALREGHEELAIDAASLEVYGQLHDVYVPRSNHMITPIVAWSQHPLVYAPSPHEVDTVIEAPLPLFMDPHMPTYEARQIQEQWYEVPFFPVQHHKVWGATALILCDLGERLRRALHEQTTISL